MKKIDNVICPFCGCLCDDLSIRIENNKIISVEKGCSISKSLFLNHDKDLALPTVYGEKTSIKESVKEAVNILSSKKHTLIYGLSSTSIETQRIALELAEFLGGSIDQTSSVCHGPTVLATQQTGINTCTLGEVKNRADVVLFWGSNPLESHQRHYKRYSLFPKGMFIPNGRKSRKLIVADVRPTNSSKLADIFLQIDIGKDYEVINVLRLLLKGKKPTSDIVGGIEVKKLKDLLDVMLSANYGVIFFGMGLTMTKGKYHNVEAAISLVRELNFHTRWSIEAMRGHYNVKGAGSVFSWQTGFPYAVNFSLGYPRYNPGEFSAVDLLRRKEVDSMLVIASDPAAAFPHKAVKNMMDIPLIVIDPKVSISSKIADVIIPTAQVGIGTAGTAYRMDGIPLRMKKLISSPYPSDVDVLSSILSGIKEVKK